MLNEIIELKILQIAKEAFYQKKLTFFKVCEK